MCLCDKLNLLITGSIALIC